jgi:hypothetical protein
LHYWDQHSCREGTRHHQLVLEKEHREKEGIPDLKQKGLTAFFPKKRKDRPGQPKHPNTTKRKAAATNTSALRPRVAAAPFNLSRIYALGQEDE